MFDVPRLTLRLCFRRCGHRSGGARCDHHEGEGSRGRRARRRGKSHCSAWRRESRALGAWHGNRGGEQLDAKFVSFLIWKPESDICVQPPIGTQTDVRHAEQPMRDIVCRLSCPNDHCDRKRGNLTELRYWAYVPWGHKARSCAARQVSRRST
jgi:hypothetical protein